MEGWPVMKALGYSRILFLYGLVIASGGLALVYEVLWMRRFVTLFGATTPAVAAVLVGMFLGLGVGSWFWGRRVKVAWRPLRVYGWLEMGTAVGCVGVELLLWAYESAYPSLYRTWSGTPAGLVAMKTALTGIALFAPTFFMGGTLPLLGLAVDAEARQLGVRLGGLYAANTAGAAVGALSVPAILLPHLTVSASYAVAVAASMLVGVGAWSMAPAGPVAPAAAAPRSQKSRARTRSRATPWWMLLALATLNGAWVFVLQVSWSRMFAQVHENSIYSIALILAVLLFGLAVGSAGARSLLARGGDPVRLIAGCWVAGGVCVMWTPRLFWALTGGLAYINAPGGWVANGWHLLQVALPTVFLPSVFVGTGFPLLLQVAGEGAGAPAGRIVGGIAAAGTLGSVVGSLAAASVLPSMLGLWWTLGAVGAALAAAGGLAHRGDGPAWTRWGQGLGVAVLIVGSLLGAAPGAIPRTRVREDRGERLVDLQESSHGIVAVVESAGSRRIKLNNFYVLGGTASTGDERMQGHLPLLLHPAPAKVAFLGLGTGITAGAALLHPVDRVTAVEIVPEVIGAVRDHFADANLGVVTSPRVEMVPQDARDFLRGAGRRFDVIVGDLFVPWHTGESSLYTSDHFAGVRRSLEPGGLFCQWLPLFQLSEDEFNMIAASFVDVFPHTTVWRGDFAPGQPALALVGHTSEQPIDPQGIARRIAAMSPDPANPFLSHPAGLWMYLVGPLDPGSPRLAGAPRNRENQPWLELLGPLHHSGRAEGRVPLFVGRRLQRFLNEVRSGSGAAGPLARIGPEEVQWRDVGRGLEEASLLVSEGNALAAGRALSAAVEHLPASIRGFFGPATPPAR